MPVDPTPSIVATQQLSKIPFGSLIGSPLNAAIQAQAQAAMTTVDFINAVGLQRDDNGQLEAVTVTFSYQDGRTGVTKNLIVPLLAIVPVPYIGIDTISIDFKANISAESSSSTTTTSSQSFEAGVTGKAKYLFFSAEFNASYSSKKDSTSTADSKYSVEYTMDVRVHATQSDMPQGLSRVLNILEEAVAERDPTGEMIITPDGSALNAVDEQLQVTLVVVNGASKPIPGASISIASGDAAVLEPSDTTVTTDAYGKGEMQLICKSLPASGPEEVDVTFECSLGTGETLKDIFKVRVG
ncbi:MAG: DUF2589 domain-containing protein [Planctomycetota bacterium]